MYSYSLRGKYKRDSILERLKCNIFLLRKNPKFSIWYMKTSMLFYYLYFFLGKKIIFIRNTKIN